MASIKIRISTAIINSTLFFLLGVSFFGDVLAQPTNAKPSAKALAAPAAIEKELKEVRSRIEDQQAKLTTIQSRHSEIQANLEALNKELAQIKQRKEAVSGNQAELDERVKKLELAVEKGKSAIEDQRGLLKRRIVAVYKMHRRSGALSYLVGAKSATDLMRRASYLMRIASADRVKLEKLTDYIDGFDKERQNLERSKIERAENVEMLVGLEKEYEAKKAQLAGLLDDAKKDEETELASLQNLEQSATKLESVLARLMGSEEPAEVAPQPKTPPSDSKPPDAVSDPVVAGEGLASFKGKLPLPVSGKLVQRFGKQKHEEFADILFVKGLEFNAPTGSKVRAVARGKVALSQVLPGYGNVIILDHGGRYYSLYGRLAGSIRQLGDEVAAGEELAILGEPDKRGRNFYFELRVQGKPVNPTEYFSEKAL